MQNVSIKKFQINLQKNIANEALSKTPFGSNQSTLGSRQLHDAKYLCKVNKNSTFKDTAYKPHTQSTTFLSPSALYPPTAMEFLQLLRI